MSMNEAMNWIGLAASVVTCATFIAAVVSWKNSRNRVMDAYIDVAFTGDWNKRDNQGKVVANGRVLRVQNIGGMGLCLHYIWTKDAELTPDPYNGTGEKPPSAVIMPGETMTLYTVGDLGEQAELVIQYITHADARIIHYDRFTLNDLSSEAFLIGASVNPPLRARHMMRYHGGEFFTDNGPAQYRRIIKLSTGGKRQRKQVMDATNWLLATGFHAQAPGTYPTADDAGSPHGTTDLHVV